MSTLIAFNHNSMSINYLSARILFILYGRLLGNVAINNNSSSQRAVFTSSVRNNESNLKLSIPQNTVPLPDLRNLNSKINVEEISNGSFSFLSRLAKINVNRILYKYNPKGGNTVYAQLLTL